MVSEGLCGRRNFNKCSLQELFDNFNIDVKQ